jgi:hypothetical protein
MAHPICRGTRREIVDIPGGCVALSLHRRYLQAAYPARHTRRSWFGDCGLGRFACIAAFAPSRLPAPQHRARGVSGCWLVSRSIPECEQAQVAGAGLMTDLAATVAVSLRAARSR